MDRMAVERLFAQEALPYELVCAGTLAEAVEIHREHPPDLALLDHDLPDGTGLELQALLEGTPCVFIAGDKDISVAIQAMKSGALDFLVKDPERTYVDLLPLVIDRALEVHRLREEVRRHTEELDELVIARTGELEETNQRLRQEITERERAERETSAIRDRLQLSIRQMPVGYILWDTNGKVTYWNPAAERIFGFTSEEAVGRTLLGLVVPQEVRPAVAEVLRRLVAGEEVSYSEPGNNIRKDGTVISCQWFNTPLIEATGEVSGVLSMALDVTERQLAEAELRRSEAIVASSSDMLALLDKKYTYLAANPAYLKAFGKTYDQVVGHKVAEVLGEEVFNRVIRPNAERCLGGAEVHFQEWFDLPASGKVYMDVSYRPYVGADNEVRGFVVNARDVTERKRAEDDIYALNVSLEHRVVGRTAELEAANKELEAFAYSVSHDLKAPLRAIDAYSGKLEEELHERLNPEGRRLLGVVRQRALHMGRLIDDLLTFSRLGRAELKISDVDMGKLAQTTFAELAATHAEREIEFTVGDLPTARADVDLIGQVWANLLDNAIKFTGQREVARIEVGYREEADRHVFYVRDNGAGFDMEYVDKLFGVFQRLHYEDEFPGTGVGLANVRRIVERHGGDAWAEGEVDHGATIFFRLPRTERTT